MYDFRIKPKKKTLTHKSSIKNHTSSAELVFWLQCRHLEKHQGQHGKHHRLDEPDEHLEEHKRQWQEIGYQVEHDGEEHFPCKNIPEQTEGERNNLAQFRHQFEKTDDRTDTIGLVKRADQELLTILHDAHSRDTGKLHGDNGDKGECEGEIEVSGSTAEERDDGSMPGFIGMGESDRTESRQQPGPVGDQDEQEDGGNEWEKLACLLLILRDTFHELQERFENDLEHVLQATWHQGRILRHASDEEYKQRTDHDTNKQGIGDW